MSNRRVLLTGGAGFIGSHLAGALLRSGAHLTIVDNLNSFYSPEWKKRNLADTRLAGEFEFVLTDLCDLPGVRRAFEISRPDAVVHLAAYAGVRPSIADPRLYQRANIEGTVNVLELCREFNVPKLVFGSSSSVYGATSRAPFREDEVEMRPISPYAATKLSGELLCFTHAHLFGFAAVCLRFFTVYGPRQRPDLAIHKFTALVEAGLPVPLFGDGTMGRDYTFVDDIVAGVLAAIDYQPALEHNARFDIFNLGNCSPVTLNELVNAIEAATGKAAHRDWQPPQPGDVPLTWADISKAQRLLGYRPSTPLADGLAKFVRWYRAADPAQKLDFSAVAAGAATHQGK